MDQSSHLQRLSVRVLGNFQDLRKRKILIDFEICVGSKRLQTHRVILAAYSDYFKAMFSHDSKELSSGRVFLQNIDANAVEAIIDFIYDGNIDLNADNIEDISLAATILQVPEVQDLCTSFIETKIDTSNCLGVAALAERCNLLDLNSKALYHCYENFNQIISEAEFLELDEIRLARIISNDRLNVSDETQVFKAVLTWIRADEENRKRYLPKLMKYVRFATIDPVTLVDLSTNDLIQASQECRNLICRAKTYLLLKNYPEAQEQHASGLITRPRYARRRIYVVGGWTHQKASISFQNTSIAFAEVYDFQTDMWTEIPPMTQERFGVGLTALCDSIYAVGGHDGQNYLNTIERLDITQNKWIRDVANMNYERSTVAVVALGNYIYAIGGQAPGKESTGSRALDKVERYDPVTNTWKEMAPMNRQRLGLGVAVLNGYIYAIGGADNFSSVHKSVERYNPEKNEWVEVSPLLIARKHLGACSCMGLIYAVGGRNSWDGQLASAEAYDPVMNQWTKIPSMHRKRAGIGLVELEGRIYAIGGQNEATSLNDVESYEPGQYGEKWDLRKPMRHCRLGCGVAVHPS